ncbi:MAG TPA: sporulation protein [Ruminococcus sp.]|nr:sporulation protein [Ruminococcus sp.]
MLRSGAANIAYAAAADGDVNGMDVQAISGAAARNSSLKTGADAYEDVADWWKADLSEYDKSLSLVSYEAAYTGPDEPLTTTTAVTTTTNVSEDEGNNSVTTITSAITTVPEPAITARQTIVAEPDSVVFYSSGYGHGVGMSQNGANFYAMYDGWTYDQILSLYYPGTQLVQTGTPETQMMTVGGKTDTVVSIVAQIVNNEMGPTFSTEALKAQAVAAYTYYLYNGGGSGMICKPDPDQKIVDAVRSVLGIVVYYNSAPALTSFYASSGGATASCKDVFSSDIPYLVSIPVRHDEAADPHFNSSMVFSAPILKAKLENAYNVSLNGNPYDWIQLEYGDGGYVAFAVIGGQVRVRGNDLRAVLGLKSPKFEFVYQPDQNPAAATIVSTAAPVYPDPGATHAIVSYRYTGVTTSNTTVASTVTSQDTTQEVSEETTEQTDALIE